MAATAAPKPRRLRLPRATVWVGLAALLVAIAAVVLYVGRDTGFYFDEWDFVQDRRGWNGEALLGPHNEHLSLVPVLIYKTLFAIAGIGSYVPYRVAGVVVHLIVLVLLFVYARRRVGDLLALGVTLVIGLLGQAWPDVVWPFQMGFLGSLAAGIGALLCLDRGDRRGEIAASVLLTVALASSSMGIPIFAAVAVEILGRPDRRSRWKILIAPAVLYALWYLGYHSSDKHDTVDNLYATPNYVAEAAAGGAGALTGLGIDWGRPLVLALIASLVLVVRRGAVDPWRLTALVALPVVFWTLTAIARADLHEPAAARYLYPSAVFLLLVMVEAARGIRVGPAALAALLVLVAGATLSNMGALRNGAGYLRDQAADLDGALAGLELASSHGVDPKFRPTIPVAPQIFAGKYLAAVKDLGSPAPGPAELPRLLPRSRATADGTLRAAYGIALAVPPAHVAGPAPAAERADATDTTARGSCLHARPQSPTGILDVAVPPAGLEIASDGGGAKVLLRRFADDFPTDGIGDVVAGGQPRALKIPSDGSTAPWHIRLQLSGPMRVCGL